MGEHRHGLVFCALAPLAIGATVPHRLYGDPPARTFWGSRCWLVHRPERTSGWIPRGGSGFPAGSYFCSNVAL